MHRSGLALAGAQTTIEAWKHEEVPPVENDGILTAEDVSTLDLQGTSLVTLSACDTGSGQARAGEGVRGIYPSRRTESADDALLRCLLKHCAWMVRALTSRDIQL